MLYSLSFYVVIRMIHLASWSQDDHHDSRSTWISVLARVRVSEECGLMVGRTNVERENIESTDASYRTIYAYGACA